MSAKLHFNDVRKLYLGFVAVHVDVPFQVELCGETLSTGVAVVNCLKREIMLSFSDFEKNMISYTIKHTILHEGGSQN